LIESVKRGFLDLANHQVDVPAYGSVTLMAWRYTADDFAAGDIDPMTIRFRPLN